MATSLSRWKEGQIGNLRSNTYHMVKNWVKIGPVDSEFSLLKGYFKKKLTQAEY